MSGRWPLHPPPHPGEALSSWVNRIAHALAVPSAVLLVNESSIPYETSNRYHLDFDPPEPVILILAEKTGQDFAVVRNLTVRGYVPSLLDTLDAARDGMADYTHALALLLPMDHRPVRHPHVLPWYSFHRFRQPRGCRDCLAETTVPYLRLHWRFSWTLSCPIHKRILEPLFIRVPVMGETEVIWLEADTSTRVVPSQLLKMDAITLQAITSGTCHLPWGSVPGALWIRLLRTVLDELGVGSTHAGNYHQTLKDLWGSVGRGYGHYLREWGPYERINQKYQETFMLMAAKAFADAFAQASMRHRIMEMARSYQETAGVLITRG